MVITVVGGVNWFMQHITQAGGNYRRAQDSFYYFQNALHTVYLQSHQIAAVFIQMYAGNISATYNDF